MLLSVRQISKSYALRTLFEGVSLSIDEGERIGLIGANGAGKSTLLRLLAGAGQAGAVAGSDALSGLDGGAIVASKGLRAAYIAQQETFDEGRDARSILVEAALGGGPAGGGREAHEADLIADLALERVGFGADRSRTPAGALSGGWRKRLSIARGLASCGGAPDLLLLDEPTNHLDLDGIAWLEEFVLIGLGTDGSRFASVFVTHDRVFLERVATSIVELSAAYPLGTLRVQGNYSEFLRRKGEFLDGQARAERSLAGQVRKDLAWLARGPQARRTKSKSRIESSHGRIDELATLRARGAAGAAGGARVDFGATGRRTRKFIEAVEVAKAMGGRQLFAGVSIELGAGECLGLLGPNGSGKTTLIRVLTGEIPPDAGSVERCEPPPRIAVFSQHRREIPPEVSLREALCPSGDRVWFRGQPMHITAWSRRFLFRDEQLDQAVGTLSGGELARVHIARIMLEPADVLILDEPTNDLDIPTLETLEEALEDFPGALVLVTHDRAMIGRLSTELLALDGRGGARLVASLEQAITEPASAPEGPEARRPQTHATATAAEPASPPARKRLSYQEQREYDGMEAAIMDAERLVAQAEASMADPAVAADHARLTEVCGALAAAQEAVARLYARWEELESRRG